MPGRLLASYAGRGRGRGARSHPVLWFVSKRVGAALLTLFIVSVLIFVCTSVLPGNAVTVILGKSATPHTVAALEARLGLDKSLVQQYLSWLGGLLHGNLGNSAVALAQQQPDPSIAGTLKDPLINSLILGGITAILLIPLTLLLGAARRHQGRQGARPGDLVARADPGRPA